LRPVVTPTEMAAFDAAAPEPVAELIRRAGWAVAQASLKLLGKRYGARVLVLAGKGNNGADGRAAAQILAGYGVVCKVVDPAEEASSLNSPPGRRFDLVIDAAYGTGLTRPYVAPVLDCIADSPIPVLAVDIPSGVNGLTGEIHGKPLNASATITFAALKPGLLFPPGADVTGPVTVADIGIDTPGVKAWHLGSQDVADRWPVSRTESHKWQRSVWVVGGSPRMTGALSLTAVGAFHSGAGYVSVSIPDAAIAPDLVTESVFVAVSDNWHAEVAADQRHGAIVVGPGLPVDERSKSQVRALLAATGDRPVVVDAGAIDALVPQMALVGGTAGTAEIRSMLRDRSIPAVITPHDGEFERLTRSRPGTDRIESARRAAADLGAVVLLKGPATVVAEPTGQVLVSTAGDQRLATAGTGDVLAGVIGAGLALGLSPFMAAGLGAEIHGGAARLGSRNGFIASDLAELIPRYLDLVLPEPAHLLRGRLEK